MLNILSARSARWLVAGGIAMAACISPFRDAQARRGVAATISNPNNCQAPSGVPWQSGVWGHQGASGAAICEVYATGATAWTPCPSNANEFDIAVTDVGGSNYSKTPYGATVVASLANGWSNSVHSAGPYTASGCGSVTAYGWATF